MTRVHSIGNDFIPITWSFVNQRTHQAIGSWKVYFKYHCSKLQCKWVSQVPSEPWSFVSIMTLKTLFNLVRSLCHPTTTQTSRLILFLTNMLFPLLLVVDWFRSLVFVIAFHKSLSFQCVFQFRTVFVISIQVFLSIKRVFQFMYSFNSSIKWFVMVWVLW